MKHMSGREPKKQTKNDLSQFEEIETLFQNDPIELLEKIYNFPKYAPRQSIARFLTKYEIYKKILHVNGSIIECGVFYGAGVLAWAKLSSILEPINHTRKIIGFDTFEGFPHLHEQDTAMGTSIHLQGGG